MDAHALAEERSIAYHELIASRLEPDGEVIRRARARVAGWLETREVHPHYAQAWAEALAGSIEALRALLVDRGERARALRQCTPFAGALTPEERWRIWREVRDRVAREEP